MIKKLLLMSALIFFVHADELKIASAAGYKKPMMEVITAFEKRGHKIEALFGNMQQVITQAKNGQIAIVIGDKAFLEKSKLPIRNYQPIGKGKVVLAFSKQNVMNSIEDLTKEDIRKVAIPQPKKAIYGTAGEVFLRHTNLYDQIEHKLYVVAKVPQVVAYLVSGEVDAGIINLTAALANKEGLGGYIIVDEQSYSPIEITAASLDRCQGDSCKEFLKFMATTTAQEIFRKYGL
ncbi:molybdate ABC transporter substrate-binding protein [Sulfurovum sp. zt1-1]|uniref:Molybdate ABC transporter substrate-binding protein n=1 Tax=Sulfurovum zhangzhouensis TaxID=3019067 RepID=A0ABT7QX23_9BACT|nr:molybdate ABC transporter substrate-binding protein [Sulfurovum zhangzhouensis]MDM5271379.1 molybdate ABC transporter substrate-binding protein [Sulfurovum zhangzhouensis]